MLCQSIAKPLSHDVGAGQRHEEHDDGGKAQLQRREISAPRDRTPRPGRIAIVIATGGRRIAAAVTGVYQLDIVNNCSGHRFTLRNYSAKRLGFAHQIRREMLRNVIIRRARHAEFIWPVIDNRLDAAEIIKRRRRRDRPLQRRRVPGIFFLRFLPREQAPEEIEQENELRADGDERRDGDEYVDGLQLLQERHRRSFRNSAADARPIPGSASA